jgi:hypothetical protein
VYKEREREREKDGKEGTVVVCGDRWKKGTSWGGDERAINNQPSGKRVDGEMRLGPGTGSVNGLGS